MNTAALTLFTIWLVIYAATFAFAIIYGKFQETKRPVPIPSKESPQR